MNQPTVCDVDDATFATGWDVMIEARRVQHRFEVAMDQCLQAFGISFAQYRALLVLMGENDMHISSLARRLRVTRQAALETVAKLARADLVTLDREAHATYVIVTPTARTRLTRLEEFADVPAALERGLSDAEQGRLVALLRKADRSIMPPRRRTWWLDD